MILFEVQIQEHQSLAQHYRELAAKREALAAELLAVQEQADASLTALKNLLSKCREASPNAIASLKSAVVSLFNDGDNDSGGNQPDSPTSPDSSDSGKPLEVLDGSSCEFASPICCQMEDAPESSLMGQSYELCSLLEDAPKPFVELVTHSDNPSIAYQRKHDGEIVCAYLGFRTKAIAQSWRDFIETIAFHVELRQAKRMEGFKWELKCKGMSANQFNRLAKECNFSVQRRPEIGSATPPFQQKQPNPGVDVATIEPGDIVAPLLAPGDSYEVLQVMPNGILDCKSLRTGVQLGMKPAAVTLVQKAVKEEPQVQESVSAEVVEAQRKKREIPLIGVGDICEVISNRWGCNGMVAEVKAISLCSELPITLSIKGNQRAFLRSELKLISKGEPKPQKQQLQSGQVREVNSQRGTFNKLAAIELVKAGLSPEMALATATGNQMDDEFDF